MIEHLFAWLALKADRRGVTALEYGLIAALIAVGIVAGATTLSTSLKGTFSAVAGSL